MSKNAKWEWTPAQQTGFEQIKKVVSRETLLHYPNFNEVFEIHTDASHTQLGAVISQKSLLLSTVGSYHLLKPGILLQKENFCL